MKTRLLKLSFIERPSKNIFQNYSFLGIIAYFMFYSAFAQTNPFITPQNVITTSADFAWDVTTGDIDSDGDIDVVSSSLSDDIVAWYPNNGSGSFGTPNIIASSPTVSSARDITLADIDNDGDLDILIADESLDAFFYMTNNGSGTFSTPTNIGTSLNGAFNISVADFDNDGDLDVVTASQFDDRVDWFENLGGTFGSIQNISMNTDGARRVITADLDGDGFIDVISSSAFDSRVAWYKNNGDGTFGAQQNITTTATSTDAMAVADFDKDGDIDLVIESNADDIIWFSNDGSGAFTAQPTIATVDSVSDLVTADVDNDGFMDIIFSAFTDNQVGFFKNNGAGGFGTVQSISTAVSGPRGLDTADLDFDGDLDVVSASQGDDKIAWYENSGLQVVSTNPTRNALNVAETSDISLIFSENLEASTVSNTTITIKGNQGKSPGFSSPVISGNEVTINPDRDFFPGEILTTTVTPNVQSTDGNSSQPYAFQFTAAVSPNSPGTFPFDLNVIIDDLSNARHTVAADLDGDGDLDVLTEKELEDDNYVWFENDGLGNFGGKKNISTANLEPGEPIPVDLDNDGDLDIVYNVFSNETIYWIENDGVGNFGAPQIISTNIQANFLRSVDLDNDGDMDVIASGNEIIWYENDGSQNFGTPQTIFDFQAAFDVINIELVDLDNDGDLDLVSKGMTGDGRLDTFLNNGDGSFGEPTRINQPETFDPVGLNIIDFTGDGSLDIIVARSFPSTVFMYENDGNGNFVAIQSLVDAPVFELTNGDLDGDGDIDLILGRSENLIWVENDGSGNIVSQNHIMTFSSSLNNTLESPADLDGDGDLDILITGANIFLEGVGWIENATPCEGITTNIAYVDENATGSSTGNDWANAFTDLQEALSVVEICPTIVTIYVAEGTYVPTTTTDRDISFALIPDVAIYGGFSPSNGAIDVATRDFETYETILSGEIGDQMVTTDNSRHVVYIENVGNNVVLDGFIITKGYASPASAPNSFGGGILFSGMASSNSSPLLTNLIIKDNFAEGFGGGICFEELVSTNSILAPTISNTTFQNNIATSAGGALAFYIENSTTTNITFNKVNFIGNQASSAGNAIYIYNSVDAIMTGTYTNCIFSSHTGDETTIEIIDAGNSGLENTFTNCLINNNQGRAFYVEENTFGTGVNTLNIVNSTITENTTSTGNGGAIESSGDSNITITNSILWNNNPDELDLDTATTNISYSLIEGLDNSGNNGLDGTNPANNPLFTDVAMQDYTLQATSPVIDLGDNLAITETEDLAGENRIQDGDGNGTATVDFGAYESAEVIDTSSFITTWQTTMADESITIPANSMFTYNYTVNWGDGTITSGETGDATHIYAVPGDYIVRISGTFPAIYFNNAGDKSKITAINQWGNNTWASMESAFYGCNNLQGLSTDVPDLSNVLSMSSMFRNNSVFNGNISGWDVSNITDMSLMFRNAFNFNQNIGNWNVSNVEDMTDMFTDADDFNQDIGNWNTSNLDQMSGMFSGASSFNQNISGWDVSNISNMNSLFRDATAFDQNIGNWDISNVSAMLFMFSNVTLSTENYDATLIGWNTLDTASGETMIPSDVSFNGGNSKYCNGETARNVLTGTFGWTITDGGLDCTTLSNETIELVDFSIYPNPVKNQFTFQNPNHLNLENIYIYDLMGRLVKTIALKNNTANTTVDVSNLESATYFVKIISDQGLITKKIVKQ